MIFSSLQLGSNLLTAVYFEQKDCIKAGKNLQPHLEGDAALQQVL